MRHLISVLLENEPGALSRVAGLFSARNYNIESLTVAPTEDETVSRMTVVTSGSEDIIEQITKQLNKLVDVVKLVELTEGPHVERALREAFSLKDRLVFMDFHTDPGENVYPMMMAGKPHNEMLLSSLCRDRELA